ncbi:MAG TPA: ATP-binding protein, partial [Candidatus Kapabacteria bacterium]|nr:ATP-binding protein [Candidatus Kapabacteria bacterium]
MEHSDSLKTRSGVTFHPSVDGEANRIVEFLQGMESFRGVPREQLEWLVRESEIFSIEPGIWNRPGDVFDYLVVILEGQLDAYVVQSGQRKTQMITGPGSMTGLLPFSRMKVSPVFVDAIGAVKAIGLHRSKFPQLIASNYELTEVLVHSMIDRVRIFTSAHFQNEKLMSLGKLSAGLAHELNNPAAAVLRSAESLKQVVGTFASSLRTVASLHVTPEEIENLGEIIEKASKNGLVRLPLLERKRREEKVADWLSENNAALDCEETFVDAGLTIDDLEYLKQTVSKLAFQPFINWLAARLQTEKAVFEIAESSRRISELVQSVKSYTRMDQVQDMQELCINDGIHNTITMLQHKMRKNSIELHEDLASGLPLILGFPGELNQVWTNIIDNALDAMKDGGSLTIRTIGEPTNVIFNVIDTGPGISPENLERIFDPFFTTKDVGEGTGVGLDVVQKVVALHHGKI